MTLDLNTSPLSAKASPPSFTVYPGLHWCNVEDLMLMMCMSTLRRMKRGVGWVPGACYQVLKRTWEMSNELVWSEMEMLTGQLTGDRIRILISQHFLTQDASFCVCVNESSLSQRKKEEVETTCRL